MSASTCYFAYAIVALDVNCTQLLTYGLSEEEASAAYIGSRVKVRVRGHERLGTITRLESASSIENVQPIISIDAKSSNLPKDLIELADWISAYYFTPLRSTLSMMTPSHIKEEKEPEAAAFIERAQSKAALSELAAKLRAKSPAQALILDVMLHAKKGLFSKELLERAKVSKSALDALIKKGALRSQKIAIDKCPIRGAEFFRSPPKTLNEEQQKACDALKLAASNKAFETHLIFGVTGSGKTEVYLQAIEHVLSLGQTALMLVPEVALTHQMIERFQSRFPGKLAALHSKLSNGERLDQWNKIREGKASVVIGPRSAVFSPMQNLGIILVDEEHDSSYKEMQKMPAFHARDVAIMRAKLLSIPVALGSATPAVETFYNAQKGKYQLHRLSKRAAASHSADVHIVDMRKEYEKSGGFTLFSQQFLSLLKKKVELGEQAVIMLNRRGYHTSLLCLNCGEVAKCPSCDVTLTYHKKKHLLACHMCGYVSSVYSRCKSCNHLHPFQFKGVGTELVESSLKALLPEIKTLRMDADTTSRKGSHEKLFKQFKTGKADVLIGTQMIAKGMDVPSVTLACVLNADMGLHVPDFRASETTFQLIAQLSGRAGRGALKGDVLLQSALPAHPVIQTASKEDYEGFYSAEISSRELFSFPPFARMVKVLFRGKDSYKTLQALESCHKNLLTKLPSNYTLYPVAKSGHAKVKEQFRYQMLIRGPNLKAIREHVLQEVEKAPSSIAVHIDVDPLSLL